MSAYIGAGVAKGSSDVMSYVREKPERDLRMQEAQNRQQLSSMRLDEYQAQSPMRRSEDQVKMQQLENQFYQGQAQGLQARTFDAFRAYNADRNVRHLNNFLPDAKKNPLGKRFSTVARYDKLTQTPENDAQLRAAGITDIESVYSGEGTNFVLQTNTDGTQKVVDMNQVYAGTGYAKKMADDELQRLSQEALNTQRLRTGMSSVRISDTQRLADIIAEENPGMPKQAAWEEATKILDSNAGGSSELSRIAKALMEENPDLSLVEAYQEATALRKRGGTYTERLAGDRAAGKATPEAEELHTEKIRSTDQVKADEVNAAKDSLDEAFEGDFLAADLTVPENRTKAGRLISRIEQEFPMTTADRKTAKEIRQLAALGDVAGEQITDQQAGPIDSMIRGVKKYFSNDVTGTEGTAAYETFRNTLRHALYGATLSSGEIDAFNSAMGSLGEQKGPVLMKLKTQVEDLKEQLSSVYDMNDPYVAKYRLNMDQDRLAEVIEALDERLEMITGAGVPKDDSNLIRPDGGKPRRSMEEIYSES